MININNMKAHLFKFASIVFTSLTLLTSCERETYPLIEYELIHFGNKSGLTAYSSTQEFNDGLDEVLSKWLANNPSTSDIIELGGISYEMINTQDAAGAVPKAVWDLYWTELEKYSYTIGSCWGFSYCDIPSKKENGTIYVLYTIVKDYDGRVQYSAVRAIAKRIK